MAVTSAAHGTQTATLDTEHSLATDTDAGVYIFVVNMYNLANGDTVILRIKTKAVHDGTARLAYYAVYTHAQTELIKYSVPVPIDTYIEVTLEQTDGTGRDFEWNLLTV
jgi:hypothetical protein